MKPGLGAAWPSGWGWALLRAVHLVPGPPTLPGPRGTRVATRVSSTSGAELSVGGPSAQLHAL